MTYLIFFLSGCATRDITKQDSAFIVLKTPAMKYADMGFIAKGDDFVSLQIYSNAQPLVKIEITNNKICMSKFKCLSKQNFNSRFLDASYPDDILEKILLGEVIWDGIGFQKKPQGFVQNIHNATQSQIFYSVLGNQIDFSDTIRNITIKVTKK